MSFCDSDFMPYMERWAQMLEQDDERNGEHFSTGPLKEALTNEIGSCSTDIENLFADKALRIFHSHDFPKFIDYVSENIRNMEPENAKKMKEICIFLAPIIYTDKNRLLKEEYYDWNKCDADEYVTKIVSLVGDRNLVTPETIQHPRFCFEMMLTALLDVECCGSSILFRSLDFICNSIVEDCDWPEKSIESVLLGLVGLYENDGEERVVCWTLGPSGS
jgi:hypothetical protein